MPGLQVAARPTPDCLGERWTARRVEIHSIHLRGEGRTVRRTGSSFEMVQQMDTRSDTAEEPGAHVAYLVREIQAGRSRDEHFQQLFRLYYPSAVHFFLRRGFAAQDAEDLAQDVLLGVYKGLEKFRHEASFDSWLFQILSNVWKNALRSRATLEGKAEKVQVEMTGERGEPEQYQEVAVLQEISEDPLGRVLAGERARLLREAIDQLPARMRQCMLLRIGQGLKYHEIAAIMGVGIASVKTHLGTAHKRLKPLLDKNLDVFFL